jgi:creatinine amidohydrolase
MQDLGKEVFGDDEGSHATASEVALTQFALPDTIKQVALDPPRAPSGRFHGPADYRRRFPDGRIGSNPGLATPELGKRFYEAAVSELAKPIRALSAKTNNPGRSSDRTPRVMHTPPGEMQGGSF